MTPIAMSARIAYGLLVCAAVGFLAGFAALLELDELLSRWYARRGEQGR